MIRYALWVCRSLTGPNGTYAVRPSMDTMPEVRRRLDWHLDPANDPSLAVRSVYGQWFPHLALIDADPVFSHQAGWQQYCWQQKCWEMVPGSQVQRTGGAWLGG